ncbi:hypothetical protein DH2020_048630 [Rehmannia glutinosa]|uniref:Uncharacterized protein n=1 Tax=Rehmannia glutinosa TaxID=99300 RepID=A0ABR0U622_REHGL
MFGLSVDSQGRSGGLALLWTKDINVTLHGFSDRYIDVTTEIHDHQFRFTGIYGEPNVALRRQHWNRMRDLSCSPKIPWIIGGDFNEVLTQNEFECSGPRAEWQMNLFRDTMEFLNMADLGYEGPKFTWSRLSVAPFTQRACVDRALCNSLWRDLFPWSRVNHIPSYFSDHSFIHIQIRNRNPSLFRRKRRKKFWFEALWVKHKDCEEVIQNLWNDNTDPLPEKISQCSIDLLNWGNMHHNNLEKQVDELKRKISSFRTGPISPQVKAEIHNLQQRLDICLELLDIKWKQRAKLHWYKEGDRNTKFFHTRASIRKQTNLITHLKDHSGRIHDSPEGLEKIIQDHFGSLFTSSTPLKSDISIALDRLNPRVTPAMNQLLSESFNEGEIVKALKHMHPFKSPGPDVISDIQSLIRAFWWGSTTSHRKTYWVSWDKMTRGKSLGGIGFRQFWAFNLALLSKQAWRLLTNPRSLIARVFKAKYHSNCPFLDVQLGYHPSWTWRSIIDSRRVLLKGCVKRIQSGTETKIWGDRWIPKPPFVYNSSPPPGFTENSRVSELIDPNTQSWNTQLLSNIFPDDIAQQISRLPLSRTPQHDIWTWYPSKNGKFSVKSAYHTILDHPSDFTFIHPCGHSSTGPSSIWKKLWSLNIHGRILHFSWRLLSNSLPCPVNLARRHLQHTDHCPFCNSFDISTAHIFFTCPIASQVWSLASLSNVVLQFQQPCADLWVRDILLASSKDMSAYILTICSNIWGAFNRLIFEDLTLSPPTIVASSSQILVSFQTAHLWPERPSPSLNNQDILRKAPPGHHIFFDGAISFSRNCAGVSVVIINHAGSFVRGFSKSFEGISDSNIAEALALLEAIALASELSLPQSSFLGDSSIVITAAKGDSESLYGADAVFADIFESLKTFVHSGFYWIPRVDNLVAYEFAHFAKSNACNGTSWNVPPDFLSQSALDRFQ